MRDVPVQHTDSKIARRNERQQSRDKKEWPVYAGRRCSCCRTEINRYDQKSNYEQSDERERAEVYPCSMTQNRTTQPFDGFGPISKFRFQLGQAGVDKVKADVRFRAGV